MATLEEKIQNTVDAYFASFDALDPHAVVGLFADDATVEDPIGTPLKKGKDELLAFYESAMINKVVIERTGAIRINNKEAAFPFQAKVNMPGARLEIDVIDTMKFNDDGQIIQMRAFFGETNFQTIKVD